MFGIGSNLTEMSRICCVYFERREKKKERRYRFGIEKKETRVAENAKKGGNK